MYRDTVIKLIKEEYALGNFKAQVEIILLIARIFYLNVNYLSLNFLFKSIIFSFILINIIIY